MAAHEVRDDPTRHRYVLDVEGHEAVCAYRVDGDTITFVHTLVPESARGQGVASRLIAAALDDARAKGMRVVPSCSAVAGYMRSHPETHDLLTTEGRAAIA